MSLVKQLSKLLCNLRLCGTLIQLHLARTETALVFTHSKLDTRCNHIQTRTARRQPVNTVGVRAADIYLVPVVLKLRDGDINAVHMCLFLLWGRLGGWCF